MVTADGQLERVRATRYVTPLREGGSLPGLMEADDDGLHVVKFRGAGQGPAALAAEVISARIAAALGLRVPELKVVEVAPELGRAEPDPEIQELILASEGANLGSDFLPGARAWSEAEAELVDPQEAAAVVWFDAFLTNVDRSPRNPNLLIWHNQLWLIDHGAALFRQHGGLAVAQAELAFPQIADHVLLDRAGSVAAAGAELAARLTPEDIAAAVAAVPDEWTTAEGRELFVEYLNARVADSQEFSREADLARR